MANDLEARQANVDLMNSFAHALDTQDWALLKSLLADDFKFAARKVEKGTDGAYFHQLEGRDAMAAFVQGTFSKLSATQHMFANHTAVLNGADEADASCYMRVHHAGKGEKAHLYQESLGRFNFQTKREGARWKIRRIEQNIFVALGTNEVFM